MYDDFVKWLREKSGAFDYDGWVETAIDYEQAADAIEELSKLNAEITKRELKLRMEKPRWIPVTERLPENGHFVLTLRWRKDIGIGYLTNYTQDGSICWVVDHDSYNRLSEGAITHWMPLPQPPKEE